MKFYKKILVCLLLPLAVIVTKPIIAESIKIVRSSFTEKSEVVDSRVSTINDYFKQRNMPLNGYGAKMIEVSDKYGLDWRLLPAIAIRETSGGKHMCRSNNPFGWGSCKIEFKSLDEAIETIGYKLANMSVYKGKSTERKLYYYNGTVVHTYPSEVIRIMNDISSL